ncbi:Fis family transcriptional regulator [Acidihalobacter ferrooxydans]|uniref:Fis family transcriptional regulator n=2 Tax=Acidihalobacter ferrooxydans TaxID=1765967 RepID=A0A1P8UCY8_9GAMM|nr:Fis family transcriptional regulator [Acidihalobacter ferrooxydans]
MMQSLIDVHDNPFVLIDDQYRVVAANLAYRRAYGLDSASSVIGRHCYELSHHLESPCHLHGEDCPHRQVFASGEAHEVLHTHYDARGEAEQVRIRGHAIQGINGELLLGEAIHRLAGPEEKGQCDGRRMIGFSPAYLKMIDQLGKSAATDAGVLLQGESGVGKELAAHFVHDRSPRATGAFVAVDCTTLTETLFETELFGHERGAFTGCVGRRVGLFEMADQGTLFLDEVGELPLGLQAKLLRVLESGEFRRVGGRVTLHADVRVVAATNRNLRQMVADGEFRQDLYYRLACIMVELPALRERRADIPALADALLNRLCRDGGRACYMTREAIDCLLRYDFPGNIRELKNVLQRAVALSGDGVIGANQLGLCPTTQLRAAPNDQGATNDTPPLRELEANYIADLLARHGGHRRRVADVMGISERTLYRKLKRYGLG